MADPQVPPPDQVEPEQAHPDHIEPEIHEAVQAIVNRYGPAGLEQLIEHARSEIEAAEAALRELGG